MCDYSLHANPNRLAKEGETLIATRFPGGSMGFVSRTDYYMPWELRDTQPLTAVCIPPGARLLLEDIPEPLQQDFGVSETEEVMFVQLSFEAWAYRDAVRFHNGNEALIQRLNENQRATVIDLGEPVVLDIEAIEKEDEMAAAAEP